MLSLQLHKGICSMSPSHAAAAVDLQISVIVNPEANICRPGLLTLARYCKRDLIRNEGGTNLES